MTDNVETTNLLWIITALIGFAIALWIMTAWTKNARMDDARQNIERLRENDPLW